MKTRTKAILGLSGVFLVGLICGALGVGMFVRENVRQRERLKDSEGFRSYFADQLKLSESQRDSISSELERAYEELADIRAGAELEYEEVFDTLASRVAPRLDPEQRILLEKQRRRILPREQIKARIKENRKRLQRRLFREDSAFFAALEDNEVEQKREQIDTYKEGVQEKRESTLLADSANGGEEDQSADFALPGPETSEEQLPQFVEFLKKRLDLSEEQVEKLQVILKKAVRRNTWIRENFKDEERQRVRRLKMNLGMLDRQLNMILTDEQRELYREVKKEWKKGRARVR